MVRVYCHRDLHVLIVDSLQIATLLKNDVTLLWSGRPTEDCILLWSPELNTSSEAERSRKKTPKADGDEHQT